MTNQLSMDRPPIQRMSADAVVTLSSAEAAEIVARATGVLRVLPRTTLDDSELLTAMEVFARALPERLVAVLSRFRRYGNDLGAVMLRNVPVGDRLPDTPVDGVPVPWADVPMATLVQLAMTILLGDVIAYADEKDGLLIQDIVPVPGAEQQQQNTGSAFLELHTEDGFHPYKPDFLSLLCLRPDHERVALTITGSVHRVLSQLDDECHELLRDRRYVIRHAASFTGEGGGGCSDPVAVLSGPGRRPELVADFHAMQPMDTAAGWALARLRTAMDGVLLGTVLEPGDALIVDNRAAIHGRTGFVPRYDGQDRWLRRCFAVADLRRSSDNRPAGSHVCVPLQKLITASR